MALHIPLAEFRKLNPTIMTRYQRFFAEQEKQRIKDRSTEGWLYGSYNARAIGACFSKKMKYPKEPVDMDNSETKKLTDAERFAAFAEAFNAGFAMRQAEKAAQENQTTIDSD